MRSYQGAVGDVQDGRNGHLKLKARFAKKPKTIIVPFDIGEFKAGDCVEWMAFMTRLSVILSQLQDALDEAEEQNEVLMDMVNERDTTIDELRDEVDGLHYEIENYYKPVNPYTAYGVSPNDF